MIMSNSSGCSLALGTVQFGLDYGITNRKGKPSRDVVAEILSVAADRGIKLLDTASGYGDSEKVLGRLSEQSGHFSIITKIPNWNGVPPVDCARNVIGTFYTSLRQLNRTSLLGLMVHLARDLASDQGPNIWHAMQSIKAAGKVAKIGISFYADDPIDDLVARFQPDFVQLPLNVLDQRLVFNGQLQRLHAAGIEIHARSVFLQGVLLSCLADIPSHLQALRAPLRKFHDICKEAGLSRLEGALAFAHSVTELSHLVIGVAMPDELEAVCHAFQTAAQTSLDWGAADWGDRQLLDPRYWPTT